VGRHIDCRLNKLFSNKNSVETHPEVKFARAIASIGAVIGSIIGFLLDASFHSLAIWTFVGSAIGALIGFRIGQWRSGWEKDYGAERFLLRTERTNILIGIVFTTGGAFVLLAHGWDLQIFLATIFFGIGTLCLTYFR